SQMKGHGSQFDRKKEAAIAALLTQRNLEEAARSIGISANTLLKWMMEPEFDVAYRDARRAAFRQSIARLQQACSAAVTTRLKVMVEPGAPPSTKVRAADSILDHSAKAIELEDIEARVAELERAAQATKENRRGKLLRWRAGIGSTPGDHVRQETRRCRPRCARSFERLWNDACSSATRY